VQHVKDGVERVGVNGQFFLICQVQIENPCETIEIHNLPQNLPMGSFRNAFHSCGANAKPHGLFLLICSGFAKLDEWESQIIVGPPSLNA
jgi:hypothetical protein